MKKNIGFTLIELMITVAIVGIIALIAYPQYQQYITRTYRIRALQNLLILSKATHSYYLQHRDYSDLIIDDIITADIKDDKHYKYRIEEQSTQYYQLVAVPQGAQAKRDQRCGKLYIDQLGEKNISGNAQLKDCWQ